MPQIEVTDEEKGLLITALESALFVKNMCMEGYAEEEKLEQRIQMAQTKALLKKLQNGTR